MARTTIALSAPPTVVRRERVIQLRAAGASGIDTLATACVAGGDVADSGDSDTPARLSDVGFLRYALDHPHGHAAERCDLRQRVARPAQYRDLVSLEHVDHLFPRWTWGLQRPSGLEVLPTGGPISGKDVFRLFGTRRWLPDRGSTITPPRRGKRSWAQKHTVTTA